MVYSDNSTNFPINFPTNMSGKLTYKIVLKKDYIRKDGTSALYVQIFLDKKRKRLPLDIYVKPKDFDTKKQIVKGKSQIAKDYNLLIEKKKADINSIAVNYRLANTYLTLDKLIEDLTNPTAKIDFIKFWELEMEKQKKILNKSTYRQQYTTFTKVKKFKPSILFSEINEDLINELIGYCKNTLKNKKVTIQSTLKNFKKYLHIANKKGARTPLTYNDITVKNFKGSRTFLDKKEIKTLYKYRNSQFISESNKNILDRFLFSCFTGLRISDIQNITTENIIGDFLAFTASKTGKFQKIKLNETAKKFINSDVVFYGNYTNEHINKQLKAICTSCNIQKRVTFHVARHSFATNFLLSGGRVENLQQLLGHSNIRETMVYVHIVESHLNNDIVKLDSVLA